MEHPAVDYLVAALITAAHVGLTWRIDRFDVLRATGYGNRMSLYTDLLTVTGILFGFTATALGSYLAFSGRTIASLRKRAGRQITDQWLSAIRAFLLALAVLLILKIVDRAEGTAAGSRWIAEAVVFFLSLRVGRLLYVFTRLVQIATAPEPSRSRRTTPMDVRRVG